MSLMLPFASLVETGRFDRACAAMADRHYSRETLGSPQCAPPGELILLRSPMGDVAFGWVRMRFRKDGFSGWPNCFLFRNESQRRGSEIIIEAERHAVCRWGKCWVFTYVDASKIRSTNPGCCFKKAGWKHIATLISTRKLIFAKELMPSGEQFCDAAQKRTEMVWLNPSAVRALHQPSLFE